MAIAEVLLILLGLVTGVASGLLGIGGGALMVPGLLAWGAPIQQAVATSLVAVFINALSGSFRNWQTRDIHPRGSLGLALGGMSTAQLGAWLAGWLPSWLLAFSFAGLQLLTIYLMGLRRRLAQTQPSQETPEQPPKQFFLTMMGIGLLAGTLSGLFGVGGGVVMVPLQMLLVGIGIKQAVRTSLGAILLISLSGLWRHSLQGNVLWVAGGLLSLGGVLGAQLGSRTLPKLPEQQVNRLFRLLLLLMATYTIIRGVESL
ncbi:sulfite exporter TauE/SafE family protein [Geitlerinema sp. P-1104]|uniref:sulfite exporter TauE/SafE family protein n=1 Tax=Geitlerinema sp. P-1104 TaxID=2546230 RepID=UPI001477384F|nr:sulfite exporter TauE/SafE family protein [Geitlerinema sp. P-1104]NMG58913.1 sulfite exporter TauE/SafE family protein [Geitlerinema sp. P-1104]